MLSGYELRDKFLNGRTTLENDILLDDTLTPTEKFIYLIIEMLSYKQGYCTATSQQMGEMGGQTEKSIIEGLQKLKAKKYIIVDTKQSRKPAKRRIFTLSRFLKLHWENELPKDCTVKKPPLPPSKKLDKEKISNSFMKFRKFMRQYLNGQKFNITTPGELAGAEILIKKNGYYRNTIRGKDLTREQSALFERLMWDARESILNKFFAKLEEKEDEN
jgi:hypothetical protein